VIQDLHSHTYYSFCGKDSPETVAEAAAKGGIELLGICDHNHGVGFGREDAFRAPNDIIKNQYKAVALHRYYDHIRLVKEKYADRIRILCGIEITAHLNIPKIALPQDADVSFFDYCMIENPDIENSIIHRDLFRFAERCGCPTVGVAHTDMFSFIRSLGESPYRYFKRMAEQNIFWEMNVNFDSTHHFRTHLYMLDFFDSAYQQELVRKSGVKLSVGFDGHIVDDYKPEIVKDYCRKIQELDIPLVFSK
jgi:histidinol phosphatase-like PHP family hydrolase